MFIKKAETSESVSHLTESTNRFDALFTCPEGCGGLPAPHSFHETARVSSVVTFLLAPGISPPASFFARDLVGLWRSLTPALQLRQPGQAPHLRHSNARAKR